MKAREHKRTYYGVPIGILMLDSKFERFNGDIGNAQTWPFPVQYKIVRGAVPNKVVDTLNNRHLFQLFADAADELIREGVEGITTTCGFLALYQQELAVHCSVPMQPARSYRCRWSRACCQRENAPASSPSRPSR